MKFIEKLLEFLKEEIKREKKTDKFSLEIKKEGKSGFLNVLRTFFLHLL